MPETEKDKPHLSIVICTFNRADHLKQCLEALTRQSFNDFEVIIIDAASTDGTPRVIADYSSRLKIRRVTEEEKELAKARDKGWRAARGDLVTWIDDDVIVSPEWAKSIVEILDNNPDVGGVSGPTIVPEDLLKNRDVFFFYNKAGVAKFLGDFWNSFFLEGGNNEVGRVFKSGAWSPGSNFPSSLEIPGLKEVDYLEACNMTLRKELVERVQGFDLNYRQVSEWSEIDLAMRIKALGYRLVFSSSVRVDHNISQAGAYSRRTQAKQRMENFLKFYFRHIFRPRADYLLKFSSYVIFLNLYWVFKAISTRNPDWLSGWVGTITGLRFFFLNQKPSNDPSLKCRWEANRQAKFQAAQTKLFINLLDKQYDQTLEIGCGLGYFSYIGAINGSFRHLSCCDTFAALRTEEIRDRVESIEYRLIEESHLPFPDNSFDLVFSADVIEHVDKDVSLIREKFRVCKNGGEIIIGTPNRWRIANLFLLVLGRLKFPLNMGRDHYGNCIHLREYRPKDLVGKIVIATNQKIKAEDIKTYPCWLGVMPLNLGLERFPSFLNVFSQFFFVKFKKPLNP